MSQHEQAYHLIQQASTFAFASDAMLRKISELMVLEEVDDAHVFVEEGEEQTKWFILDEGTVTRYKLVGTGEAKQPQRSSTTTRTTPFDDDDHVVLDFVEGAGFVGIAVALMGRSHPVGVVLAALLFGALYQGGAELQFEMPAISREMIVVIQALVILFTGALDNMVRMPVQAAFLSLRRRREAQPKNSPAE